MTNTMNSRKSEWAGKIIETINTIFLIIMAIALIYLIYQKAICQPETTIIETCQGQPLGIYENITGIKELMTI